MKGDDLLQGRGGDDNAVRGDQGNDRLLGGPGEDHLVGGFGKDVLRGGDGFDLYLFEHNWGKETIDDSPLISGDINTGRQAYFTGVRGDLTIDTNSGPGPEVKNESKTSQLNWGNDLIGIVVAGGSGHDTIIGRAVADNIQVFNNSGGTKTISGGGGDDFVYSANGIAGDQILRGRKQRHRT